MQASKTVTLLSAFLLSFFSCSAVASDLVRFYTDHDSYHLVPRSSITNIYVDVDDQEVDIYTNGDKSVLWKITLEDIPEEEALKLVDAIYSGVRKTILNVKVASFN